MKQNNYLLAPSNVRWLKSIAECILRQRHKGNLKSQKQIQEYLLSTTPDITFEEIKPYI